MFHRRTAASAGVAVAVALVISGCATANPATTSSSAHPANRRTSAPGPSPSPVRTGVTSSAAPTRSSKHPTATRSVAPSGRRTTLPVDEPTHGATQVITVVAPEHNSTTAVLQRWARTESGWEAVGSAVPANLGTDGMSRHASESRSATPIGSFTLTRAFGHDADPGTRLPYTQTTPDDWWISQPGPLYNTRQRCASQCPFAQGDPNEHLYYETPAYDYAVVIDYNTRNAPGGVHQGAGSAFFLHVSEGVPTAGCVSIPVQRLLHIMAWLRPKDRPRILIGTG